MALAVLPVESHESEYGRIAEVAVGSAADCAGLAANDVIVHVNGHLLRDVIDFRFYTSDDELTFDVRRGNRSLSLSLTHGADNPLGVTLQGTGLETIRECTNHCPFCFVTQLPPGMRQTLHIKDDDYRYSFLFSHFVTLTNLEEEDWRRIEEQHLSPLYVSVHSTDAQMRRRLLGNRFAEDPLEQIDRLTRLGITVHTQLVTCPGINDGPHVEESVQALMSRFPQVQSVAVVPVGLTKTRTERTMSRGMPLRKFYPEESLRVVEQVEAMQAEAMTRYGVPVVYACDEFYLVAGREVPGAEFNDEGQIENGVGMVRQLLDDWWELQDRLPKRLSRPRHLTFACGTLIAPVMERIIAEMNRIQNLRVDLRVVTNTLFGAEVTCSGLMIGRDVLTSLEGGEIGDTLVLPRDMFDHEGQVTLDDMTRDRLQASVGRPLAIVKRFSELQEVIVA